jgi:peptidoglycan/LPS O-acetylase OafA/YrhL
MPRGQTLEEAPPWKRIQLLDVARGLAAIAVVLHHVLRSTPGLNAVDWWKTPAAQDWWIPFVFLGDLAVTLFFVLSGVSLAMGAVNRVFRVQEFCIKRFFRIYPLYVFAILAYFVFRPVYHLLVHTPQNDWLSEQYVCPLTIKTWATYLTMTSNFVNGPPAFNSALWSLPIEMQFYLFFPLLVFLVGQKPRAVGNGSVILFGAAMISISHFLHLPGRTTARLWEFAGGVVIGANLPLIWTQLRRPSWRAVLLLAALFFFLSARLGFRPPIPLAPYNWLDVMFSFSLVALILTYGNWSAHNGIQRLLVGIGVWSYSVYLLHNLVLGLVAPLVTRLELPAAAHAALVLLIVVPVTVLLSAVAYRWLEKPCMELGHRLARRRVENVCFSRG